MKVTSLQVIGGQQCTQQQFDFKFLFLLGEVKESCNRPGVAQRVPGALGSQIS